MIITHSNKFLSPKSKLVGGIYSDKLNVPDIFISSNSVRKSKKYWANANTAAYFKEAKKMAEEANSKNHTENKFPEFIDLYCKQIFLKRINGYIAHTPLLSCALIDEFSSTVKEMIFIEKIKGLPWFFYKIELSGVILANRGELATKHQGSFMIKANQALIEYFSRYHDRNLDFKVLSPLKPKKIHKFKVNLNPEKKYLFFHGKACNANLNSGFVSAGLPALTAVGGVVDTIGLSLGAENIPFAFGIKNTSWTKGGKVHSTVKKTKNTKKETINQLVIGEITGSFDFCLVLDITGLDYDKVKTSALKIKKIAGGGIFSYDISENINNDNHSNNNYLFFRKRHTITKTINKKEIPVKTVVLSQLHLISSGYALLEKPGNKNGVRINPLNNQVPMHAFTETLFSCISLTKTLNSISFFKRTVNKNYTAYV